MPFQPLKQFQGLLDRMVPQDNYGGLLSPQDQHAAAQAYRAQLGAGLLSAAGPQRMPVSLGQALGAAMPQAAAARDYRAETGIRNDQIRRQIDNENRQKSALSNMRGLLPSLVGEENAPFFQGLFDVSPEMALSMAMPAPQKPNALDEKFAAVEGKLGRPLTNEEVMTLSGGGAGTTINVGETLNKPIPIPQLDSVRLPDGGKLPLGTTFAQAQELGAQVVSGEDQKRAQQADQAVGILDQLEELAIGPKGVFNEVMPGMANRVASAFNFAIDMVDQKDPRAAQFKDLSEATLAPFIKFLGESGALADGDVKRGLGLLPRIWPLPDTKEVATDKIRSLREIVNRGVGNLNSGTRVDGDDDDVPPPPGYTLDDE
jgi:hypothetical protein